MKRILGILAVAALAVVAAPASPAAAACTFAPLAGQVEIPNPAPGTAGTGECIRVLPLP